MLLVELSGGSASQQLIQRFFFDPVGLSLVDMWQHDGLQCTYFHPATYRCFINAQNLGYF
jgi:hypothetical protein